MKIGYKEFVSNPVFPVNRMLRREQHMRCSDDLHGRILYLQDEGKPFVHISIDSVEIYQKVRNQIKVIVEDCLCQDIHLVVSATHSHNCPCITTDQQYQDYLLNLIKQAMNDLIIQEYETLSYQYQYQNFDQVGCSRVVCQKSDQIYAETLSIYHNTKRLATILIHNVHPTIRKLWEGDFTAEYPGYVITKLKEIYPDEFFTFMLGPAGDISPRFVRKASDEAEMKRLAECLLQEYQRQLTLPLSLVALDGLAYEEIELTIGRTIRTPDNVTLPKDMCEEELAILEKARVGYKHEQEEVISSHLFSHLILSKTYSMIFEPFELYSGFYRSVNKAHCSLITISNGFDHYVTDLRPQRVARELFADTVADQTKEEMMALFHRWSEQ